MEDSLILGGTLDVRLTNGIVPNSSDAFAVMTYTTRSGAFDLVSGPCAPTYKPTALVLVCSGVAPSVKAGLDATRGEGEAFTRTGSLTDADSPSWDRHCGLR